MKSIFIIYDYYSTENSNKNYNPFINDYRVRIPTNESIESNHSQRYQMYVVEEASPLQNAKKMYSTSFKAICYQRHLSLRMHSTLTEVKIS